MKKQWLRAILSFVSLFTSSFSFITGTSGEFADPDPRNNYDVRFYGLDLEVSDTSAYIRGSVSIRIECLVPLFQQAVFDFSDALTADSVTLNGQILEYTHDQDVLTVSLPDPAAIGTLHDIRIYYHGPDKNSGPYHGIYSTYNLTWNIRITWTLSEPFSAMNWFPCKQALTDKADSVYVFISSDSYLKAGSNGVLTAQVPLPGNRIRYEWKSRHPIDYYLISFTVANYTDYSFYVRSQTGNDSILVQNYVYNNPAFLEQNKSDIDITADLILMYADLFGVYPFRDEKYGHCTAPMGGGMEHQTMTTLANFSFLLVAHELAHQWFGDYVTCSTWSDIWINEGFASYGEYLSNQYLKSQSVADSWMTWVHEYVKSIPGGSVYVPENHAQDEDRIFDYRLTYRKGAAIIHMIRYETGNDSLFFNVLTTFLEKYKYSQASGLDFRDHLEEKTGKDFHDFFDQWYFGEGYPVFSVSWNQQNDTLTINSLQTTSSSTQLFIMPVEFRITGGNLDTLIQLKQTSNFNTWKIFLTGSVSSVVVDPNHWLLIEASDVHHTGISEQEAKLSVVPNPAKEQVNIYYSGKSNSYTLFLADSSGKILYSANADSNFNHIDISRFPTGIYFIIIKEPNIIHQAKFIIY